MITRVVGVLALISTLAHAQAMAPLPEPVAEPVPSFATPGATPAGAGASHGMLATPEQQLPRSPNKRVLPSESAPGVWAADGEPEGPNLFGEPVPVFDPSRAPTPRSVASGRWTPTRASTAPTAPA